MVITLKKDLLMSVLQNYATIVRSNNIIRSFENILITYTKERGELCFLGSDGNVTLKSIYDEKLDFVSDFSFSVPGQLLISMVSSLSRKDINFDVTEKELTINDGKSKFTLSTANGEDFPIENTEINEGPIAEISVKALRKMLAPSAFCPESGKVRPALNGVHIYVDDSKIISVGSDAKEMMEVKITPVELHNTSFRFTLPLESVKIIQRMVIIDSEKVYLFGGIKSLYIKVGKMLLGSVLNMAQYPDYRNLINLNEFSTQFELNKNDLKQTISRALIALDKSDIPKVAINFNCEQFENGINISGGYNNSHFNEDIQLVKMEGEKSETLLNVRRFREVVSMVETPNVVIKSNSLDKKPVYVENDSSYTDEEITFWMFVMPLRSID